MQINSRPLFILAAVMILAIAAYAGHFMLTCAIALPAFIIYSLLTDKYEGIPIGRIMLSIAGLQWLISPISAFNSPSPIYPMAVSEDVYFGYTLILYVPMCVGYFMIERKHPFVIDCGQMEEFCTCHIKSAKLLVIMGFIANLIPINIPAINFVKTLLEMCLFIGGIMLMCAYRDKATMIAVVIVGFLGLKSIFGGMFHDLMVWGMFMLFMLFYLKDVTLKKRAITFALLLFCVVTLQAVKPLYRSYIWESGYSGNKVMLFVNLYLDNITGDVQNLPTDELTARFNQGWIISRIYNHVPGIEPYANGRTILEGVESALLPRFLAPNKKDSGKDSLEDFTRFTGYKLGRFTSMGLSILGEAYANFGLFGGAAFMFIWGLLVAKLLQVIIYFSKRFSMFWYFFAPLICFDIIKAEINFISVLNWTVKAMVFTALMIYMLKCRQGETELECAYSSEENERE